MTDDAGISPDSAKLSVPSDAERISVGGGTVVLISLWIGLIVGFLDLGILLISKQWFYRDFYRLGADFPWIIPLTVTILLLITAFPIALFAWIRGSARLGFCLGLLTVVGSIELCSRMRLEIWASSIVCIGALVQVSRFVRPRQAAFVRLVRRSFVGLFAVWLFLIAMTAGRRAWSEYQQTANLPPAPAGKPNVVLIVWDTVRASNTSLHGYRRETTPRLKELASRGARFDKAFSTSSWTLPSHASMFTSRWPHELGVDWKRPMRGDVPTLAEQLAARGYDTAGFVGNLDYCSSETGLSRGFAHYEDFPITPWDSFIRYTALGRRLEFSLWTSHIDEFVEKQTGRWHDLIPRSREHVKNADSINKSFLGWLRGRSAKSRPFFAFLNFNDAHTPYEVPETSLPPFGLRPTTSQQKQTLQGFTGIDKQTLSREDVRMANDVYDDGIRYLDQQLGALLDELKRTGALENTVLIVTADHGEHLGDHGLFFHGGSLYRQVVQVPLVIVANDGAPAGITVEETVSLADIPATVIDLLGFGPDHGFYGRSIAECWRRPTEEGKRVVPPPLLMETTKPEILANEGREPAAKGPVKGVVAAGMHYLQNADGREEMYNLKNDVEEKVNLAADAGALPVILQFRDLLRMLLRKR